MRNIFILLLVVSIIACSFSSCSHADINPLATVTEFEREFMTGGRIYYSLASEGERGYVKREMFDAIFPDGLPGCEYSLLIYSSLSSVSELGVFKLEDRGKIPELISVLSTRIKLLSLFMEGESFIYEKGRVVAYGFFDNAEEAKKLLKSLL